MEIRPFSKKDFATYRSWYADPDLNRELGPMDDQWLEFVLGESPPKEFSFLEDGNLVAVIGTAAPESQSDATWYITAIAVDPSRKRKGVGKQALQMLIQHHAELANTPQVWIAWVGLSNQTAVAFFEELGWIKNVETKTDDMYQFRLEMS